MWKPPDFDLEKISIKMDESWSFSNCAISFQIDLLSTKKC